jgi:hypothetical protein
MAGVVSSASSRVVETKDAAIAYVSQAKSVAADYVAQLTHRTSFQVQGLQAAACKVAADPQMQVAAVSAAVGATTIGTMATVAGAVAGGFVGGAAGVVPALFTFGMSIPVGAIVGGTVGGGAGATLGGTSGLAAGGAAGYVGYAHKDTLKSGLEEVRSRAGQVQAYATSKVHGAANCIKSPFVNSPSKLA